MSHRKEPAKKRANEESQPTSTVRPTAETAGRLAGLIAKAWPDLPGHPGAKLLAQVAAILADDIPLQEFRRLLESKRGKVQSFGLAESLARELRERRNGDDTRRKQRQDAEVEREIQRLESMLAEKSTTAEERDQLLTWLADLRRKPKPTTARAHKGAA